MLRKLLTFINLRNQVEDLDKIHTEIENGIDFKGTNLWILVFAIIVASVGLNTNSTAVIIGAMLISPLMGPINGMGYSVATYDFALFKRSIWSFVFAVIASIAASTIYFAITPMDTAHSELLARTHPTIYDVMIALFGGLAGIIAISSKIKGNILPGVAIATALMPPLCTAGYGLATGQFQFFFGAFYLFTINSVFIGLASVIVCKFLKFPLRMEASAIQKKRINWITTIVILITFVPSTYFGYKLVQNEKFKVSAVQYCNNITIIDGAFLLEKEIDAENKTIHLVYGGNFLTAEQKKSIIDKSNDFDLKNPIITIDQGFSMNEVAVNENDILKNQISLLNNTIKIERQKIDSIVNKPFLGKDLLREIKPLYPAIKSCSYAETYFFNDSSEISTPTVLVIFSSVKDSINLKEKTSISEWLKARLKTDNVRTLFDEIEPSQFTAIKNK